MQLTAKVLKESQNSEPSREILLLASSFLGPAPDHWMKEHYCSCWLILENLLLCSSSLWSQFGELGWEVACSWGRWPSHIGTRFTQMSLLLLWTSASVAVVVNVVITGVHHPYCRTLMTSTLHGVTAKKKLTWLLEHSKVWMCHRTRVRLTVWKSDSHNNKYHNECIYSVSH